MLGVAFASSLGLSLWLYRKMTALKNLQYRESLERVESQEAYENLLFSLSVKETIANTIENLQTHVVYLQEENRLKVRETEPDEPN